MPISQNHRRAAACTHAVFALALCALLTLAGGGSPLHAANKVAEAPAATATASTVNINTADARTLAVALNGIGLSRAEDIVRYREQFGPFTTVDQLTEVKGVGTATVEKNRARITLD
ncbi:ComEA family DNA-binding protein [Mangrovimicrobium sediminis]|uniref:ComEA family DNA-binding protein n=1 Tax=Mangrovimicrobium sediminis TaxID=2562682 RepID=A0A4Z0M1S1_9GAMM|nr:ComEA family DNA-binding protein [Haliea sp. SAOS-164]